jgi:hypothetical protein
MCDRWNVNTLCCVLNYAPQLSTCIVHITLFQSVRCPGHRVPTPKKLEHIRKSPSSQHHLRLFLMACGGRRRGEWVVVSFFIRWRIMTDISTWRHNGHIACVRRAKSVGPTANLVLFYIWLTRVQGRLILHPHDLQLAGPSAIRSIPTLLPCLLRITFTLYGIDMPGLIHGLYSQKGILYEVYRITIILVSPMLSYHSMDGKEIR